ncbi:MAG: hypothetical protein KatS3mg002_0950 [Candidatus Woesearchaeota archaeon]|nr:MAG: hypothetical protein KatS3mg002_0950 [Candidatus Woesearchaeota archaeon]
MPKNSKKNPKKINKAAIYVRVSTEEQAKEGFSLAGQEQALKEHAKLLGYEVYKIYKDEGKSAKDLHRPALQQMLSDAEKQYFSAIIVYKLDRFSRSLKDLILTIEKLKELGIDFISMQDRIETASASGKLMFHIISSFAEFERDIISERTRFGMIEKAKEGGIVSKPPLGYQIKEGKLVIDPEQAEKVRVIFDEYLNTVQSLNKIAKKHGLTVRGLIQLLQNRTYIGEIKFKENYKGEHEAIISKEIFIKVKEKLESESQKRAQKRYEKILQKIISDNNLLNDILELLLNGEITLEEREITENLQGIPDKYVQDKSIYDKSISDKDINAIKEAVIGLLKQEGFSENEIFNNRVYINADNPWMSAINNNHKIYVEYAPDKFNKLLDYLNEYIEVWLFINNQKYYVFKNIN